MAKPRARVDGSIVLAVKVPGGGRVTVLEKPAGARFVFGRGSASTRRAGTLHLTIRPTARARHALATGSRLHVRVTVGYTPKGGTKRTVRLTLMA